MLTSAAVLLALGGLAYVRWRDIRARTSADEGHADWVRYTTQRWLEDIALREDFLLREDASRVALELLARDWPSGLQAECIELDGPDLTVQLGPASPMLGCGAQRLRDAIAEISLFEVMDAEPHDSEDCVVAARFHLPEPRVDPASEASSWTTEQLMHRDFRLQAVGPVSTDFYENTRDDWQALEREEDPELYTWLVHRMGARMEPGVVTLEELGWVEHEGGWRGYEGQRGVMQRVVLEGRWDELRMWLDKAAWFSTLCTIPELSFRRVEGSGARDHAALEVTLIWWQDKDHRQEVRAAPWPDYPRVRPAPGDWPSEPKWASWPWTAVDPFSQRPPTDGPLWPRDL